MKEWVKELGGSRPWENKVGLDEKSVELLAEDLGALAALDAGLPAWTMRYLLDGEGEELLERLATMPTGAAVLGLTGSRSGINPGRDTERDTKARVQFFEGLRCPHPEFFVRLGKFYDAAFRLEQAALTKTYAQFSHVSVLLPPPSFGAPSLNWLELLLIEATQFNPNAWPRSCRPCVALSAELVESMLQSEGQPPDLLVRAAFLPKLDRFTSPVLEAIVFVLQGFAESAIRHKAAVLEALNHPDVKQRVYALGLMKNCVVPAEPFAETLVNLAVGPAKQVREQAEYLLAGIRSVARPLLERKILDGTSEERGAAVRLLWNYAGGEARAFLEQRQAEEKSRKVLQTIQEVLVSSACKPGAAGQYDALKLPELAPYPSQVLLGPETQRAWQECFEKINLAIAQQPAGSAGRLGREFKPVSQATVDQAFAALQGIAENGRWLEDLCYANGHKSLDGPLKVFWQRPELHLLHLVRFLVQVGAVSPDSRQHADILGHGFWLETFLPVFRRTHPEVGLRELGAAFTVAGLDPKRIGRGLLANFWGPPSPFGLPDSQVWPYWAEHLDLLEEALAPQAGDFMARYQHRQGRKNVFYALRTFPQPAPRLAALLWNMALGAKHERPQAQRCLEGAPDKFERLTGALESPDAETRLVAAEWLARLGDQRAIAALLPVLKREKNEAAKGALMGALEQLGASIDQFLDRPGLQQQAEKGLAKGVPEELNWFPLGQLPAVHWADTREAVEPEIVRWWLVQGFKLKNPEPGALLRRYCKSLVLPEREALGQFILEAWIAEDTAPIPRAAAEQKARTEAQSLVHYAQYLSRQVQHPPSSPVHRRRRWVRSSIMRNCSPST